MVLTGQLELTMERLELVVNRIHGRILTQIVSVVKSIAHNFLSPVGKSVTDDCAEGMHSAPLAPPSSRRLLFQKKPI